MILLYRWQKPNLSSAIALQYCACSGTATVREPLVPANRAGTAATTTSARAPIASAGAGDRSASARTGATLAWFG